MPSTNGAANINSAAVTAVEVAGASITGVYSSFGWPAWVAEAADRAARAAA
jgi:hypothetical protein